MRHPMFSSSPLLALVFVALSAALALPLSGCDNAAGSGNGEFLGAVRVTLSGNVIDADREIPLPGIKLTLTRKIGEGRGEKGFEPVEDLGVTRPDGRFGPSEIIDLLPEDYEYYLRVEDPAGHFFPNDSVLVFALKDGALDFEDIRLTSNEPEIRSQVSGTVVDARSDTPVTGAVLSLRREGEVEPVATAISDAMGAFNMTRVLVAEYQLEIDGRPVRSPLAPEGYIDEILPIVLLPEEDNLIGSLPLIPVSKRQDLTCLLTWKHLDTAHFRPFKLDMVLTLPGPDFDLNHLFGQNVHLSNPEVVTSPTSGFGEETPYWPGFLGGNDQGRVRVDSEATEHKVGERIIAKHSRTAETGQEPEVLTFFQQNPMAEFPKGLGYHYTLGEGADAVEHYPVGIAVVNVNNLSRDEDGGNENIFESEARLKLYIGTKLLGDFDVAELYVPPGEPNRVMWTPLIVEYGFTKPDPTSDDDVYFNPRPLSAMSELTPRRTWAYEDEGPRAAGLREAYAGVVFEDHLYIGGSDGGEGPGSFGLWGLVWEDHKLGWKRMPEMFFSRSFEAHAFVVHIGDIFAGGINHAPDMGGRTVIDLFKTDEGNNCPHVETMRVVDGEILLGTSVGLRVAGHCDDVDLEMLHNAPGKEIRTINTFEFAAGPRMLIGGDGTGLLSTFDPRNGTPDWTMATPGEGAQVPAGATVNASIVFEDNLFVGLADGGGLYIAELDDMGRDVWTKVPEPNDEAFDGFPSVYMDVAGMPVDVSVVDMAHHDYQLFVATNVGIWRYDPFADGTYLHPFWSRMATPITHINHLVVLHDDLYALAEEGVLRIH